MQNQTKELGEQAIVGDDPEVLERADDYQAALIGFVIDGAENSFMSASDAYVLDFKDTLREIEANCLAMSAVFGPIMAFRSYYVKGDHPDAVRPNFEFLGLRVYWYKHYQTHPRINADAFAWDADKWRSWTTAAMRHIAAVESDDSAEFAFAAQSEIALGDG